MMDPELENELALGIDIGGTVIKAGLLTKAGRMISSARVDTPAGELPDKVVEQVLTLTAKLMQRANIQADRLSGAGISIAGFITANGIVTATAHLSKQWIGFNLRERLLQDLPTRLFFSLDTPAPTLGEAYYGAGKGLDDFAYVTVSTGIGAGLIARGQYYTGGLDWAGGVGHIIIDENSPRICEGCGNHGCLETFSAKQGIIDTALELVGLFPHSEILRLVENDPGKITPKIIFLAAKAGDPAACEVFRQAGHALGLGLVSLANIFAPARIVVGGGIAQAGELLLAPARDVVVERAFPPRIRRVEIVQASLGDLSGVYGAAAMVFYDLIINSPMDH